MLFEWMHAVSVHVAIALLLLSLLLWCVVMLARALRWLWTRGAPVHGRGMGQRPMEDLSRAAYPTARGAGCPARGCHQCPDSTLGGGDGRRRDKHGAGPRSTAPAQPWPHSSLINRTAAAGDPLPVLGAGGSESGGKHSFLEESVP